MNMVERVAQAIFEAWAIAEGSDATWADVLEMNESPGYANAKKWHSMAIAEARAAIEAMREPTEGMLRAAMAEADKHGYQYARGNVDEGDASYIFTAMIDAALTSPPALAPSSDT